MTTDGLDLLYTAVKLAFYELNERTENIDALDTEVAVAAVLADLEKVTENTDANDIAIVEDAVEIAVREIKAASAAEKASKIDVKAEIEKHAEAINRIDPDGSWRLILTDFQYLRFIEKKEETSEFYEPGVSNRNLENTSFSELNSILDDLISPVGERFIDTAIAHSPLEGRQHICKFLGIRESTMSGWIKDKRVPRMAQAALLFLMAFEGLKRQTKIWRVKMTTTLPVQIGSSWGVMRIDESNDGGPKGVVIAEGIPSFEHAAQLAKAPLAISQLKECLMLLGLNSMSDAYTMFHDDVEYPKESELYREITATVLKGDKDIEKWIREITEESE